MPNVRGASRSTASGAEVPLLVVGLFLLLMVMAAYLRLQYRQQRRQKRQREYLPPLLQATTEEGLLAQIAQRKQSLHQFIARLRTQLEDREQQLRAHDELENVVTSRKETSRRDDEQWRALMKAGRKLHGKKWNAKDGDGPSLRELMEIHKDELLEYKRSIETDGAARRSRPRPEPNSRSELTEKDSRAKSIAAATPRVVPPQWQSTRRLASSVRPVTNATSTELEVDGNGMDAVLVDVPSDDEASGGMRIPRLNLSKLRPMLPSASAAADSVAATEASADAGVFGTTFQRKTRLARMFSRRRQ